MPDELKLSEEWLRLVDSVRAEVEALPKGSPLKWHPVMKKWVPDD